MPEKNIYEALALVIKDGDSFADSYDHEAFAYVDEEGKKYLENILVPDIDYWPVMHLKGLPMFICQSVKPIGCLTVKALARQYLDHITYGNKE